jgi:hypothetical protein
MRIGVDPHHRQFPPVVLVAVFLVTVKAERRTGHCRENAIATDGKLA